MGVYVVLCGRKRNLFLPPFQKANAPSGLRADMVELLAWLHKVLEEERGGGSHLVEDFVI